MQSSPYLNSAAPPLVRKATRMHDGFVDISDKYKVWRKDLATKTAAEYKKKISKVLAMRVEKQKYTDLINLIHSGHKFSLEQLRDFDSPEKKEWINQVLKEDRDMHVLVKKA